MIVNAQYRLYKGKDPESPSNSTCMYCVAFYLLVVSFFSIAVPIILFMNLGDILVLTHTDVINSITLLSGVITLPAAIFLIWALVTGTKISPHLRVAVCPLWCSIMFILTVNIIGVVHCVKMIIKSDKLALDIFQRAMLKYRTMVNYRRFVDNLQWNLRCCGVQSYKDWFHFEWYDKSTEGDVGRGKRTHNDCVPFSCCKSGACISSYLSELGTYFINKKGCASALRDLLTWFIFVNLILFTFNIIIQLSIFSNVLSSTCEKNYGRDMSVHTVGVNNNYKRSSTSGERMPIMSKSVLKAGKSEMAAKSGIAPVSTMTFAPSAMSAMTVASRYSNDEDED